MVSTQTNKCLSIFYKKNNWTDILFFRSWRRHKCTVFWCLFSWRNNNLALTSDEEEQCEKVFRKVWTKPWISRRNNDGASFAIFQELIKNDSGGFKDLFWLQFLNVIKYYYIIWLSYHIVFFVDFIFSK